MIEDKDYITRLIHQTVRTLVRLIWNRDMDKGEEGAVSFALLQRYQELAKMKVRSTRRRIFCWMSWTRKIRNIFRWLFASMKNWEENQKSS